MYRSRKRKITNTDSEIDRELDFSDSESDASSLFSSNGDSEYLPDEDDSSTSEDKYF